MNSRSPVCASRTRRRPSQPPSARYRPHGDHAGPQPSPSFLFWKFSSTWPACASTTACWPVVLLMASRLPSGENAMLEQWAMNFPRHSFWRAATSHRTRSRPSTARRAPSGENRTP
ncbi:hypothetical protein [Janthinobacterium lividum]|uniref:hypothetical protein n=1 Tax=Janthinobacterium lividum TaxID=29581 RepID=UPI000FE26E5A|nr:hypothetical protein [Janthinobacterium lividum]